MVENFTITWFDLGMLKKYLFGLFYEHFESDFEISNTDNRLDVERPKFILHLNVHMWEIFRRVLYNFEVM